MTFDPPRWPNGPKICPVANLPAFYSPHDLHVFLESNSPGTAIIHQWKCIACAHWHAKCVAASPAGASSGTTRTAKHIEELKDSFWQSALAKTCPTTIAASGK